VEHVNVYDTLDGGTGSRILKFFVLLVCFSVCDASTEHCWRMGIIRVNDTNYKHHTVC
jgi:hypothetical protein